MPRRTIRLMPEYGCAFPVWEPGSDLPPDFVTDEQLRRDILEWNQVFEDHFHWDDGWSSAESRQRFADAAPGLVQRLQDHLGPDVHVVAELWPLGGT